MLGDNDHQDVQELAKKPDPLWVTVRLITTNS